MPNAARGAPYPSQGDVTDVPEDLQKLAEHVDKRPGIETMTTAQRNALSGVNLWPGRVVLNTTTQRHERYTGSKWLGREEFEPVEADKVALVVRGLEGQTAALEEWRRHDNVVLARVTAAGQVHATGMETSSSGTNGISGGYRVIGSNDVKITGFLGGGIPDITQVANTIVVWVDGTPRRVPFYNF
jgi:hypothetical protein